EAVDLLEEQLTHPPIVAGLGADIAGKYTWLLAGGVADIRGDRIRQALTVPQPRGESIREPRPGPKDVIHDQQLEVIGIVAFDSQVPHEELELFRAGHADEARRLARGEDQLRLFRRRRHSAGASLRHSG